MLMTGVRIWSKLYLEQKFHILCQVFPELKLHSVFSKTETLIWIWTESIVVSFTESIVKLQNVELLNSLHTKYIGDCITYNNFRIRDEEIKNRIVAQWAPFSIKNKILT